MTEGFGIDFGTTNSVAARSDAATGRTLPFTDRETNLPHPSVVWYRGNQVVVGKEAKHQLKGFADEAGNAFVRSIKRKLGRDSGVTVFGERKEAYEIAAEIFRFLRQQAKDNYDYDLENVVLTVPVRFEGTAREDLRKAANAAGIEIKTFIHEPFAAVIGYCYSSARDIESLNGLNILVFDWGGGTLDITVARIKDGQIFELATAGLEDIAGDHFDSRLESYARGCFLNRHGLREDILSLRPGTRAKLSTECERAKISLSSRTAERLQLRLFFHRESLDYDLDAEITRPRFEGLIATDVDAALRQVDQVIGDAALTPEEIDAALLIGGSSRIPMLRSEMNVRFGARAIDVRNADTIIAEGAAIIAQNDWLPYLARPIQVRLSDGALYTIFERGQILKPEVCRKEVSFYCTDNRDGEAHMVIVESLRPGDTTAVRTVQILNVPVSAALPRPYNHERVSAVFEIDENLVFWSSAWSATQQSVVHTPVHDICFGLRVR